MYGVLFTQLIDNEQIGVLLFHKQSKAEMAYRVLKGLEELSSLDERVNSVLETSDVEEVPEIETDKVNDMISLQFEGKTKWVQIINPEDIPDIE